MILEAGEHQKPLKGVEDKQSAASGQYQRKGREDMNEKVIGARRG